MKLVDNWPRAWRWISMQAFTAIAAGHAAIATLPTDTQVALLTQHGALVSYVTLTLAFLGAFGRMVQQGVPPQ